MSTASGSSGDRSIANGRVALADIPPPSSTTASPNESIRPSVYPTAPYWIATTWCAASRNARARSKAGDQTSSSNACGRSGTTHRAIIDTTTTGPGQRLAAATASAHSWYIWRRTAREGARTSRGWRCRRRRSGVSSWSARTMGVSASRRENMGGSRSNRSRGMPSFGKTCRLMDAEFRRHGTGRFRCGRGRRSG